MTTLSNDQQKLALFLNDQVRCLRDQCLYERSSLEAIKHAIELLHRETFADLWREERLEELQQKKAAAIEKLYQLTQAWAIAERDLKAIWDDCLVGAKQ